MTLQDQFTSFDLPFDAFYDIKFNALTQNFHHVILRQPHKFNHHIAPRRKTLLFFSPSLSLGGSILHVSSCASIDCHLFSIQEGRERKCCDRSLFFVINSGLNQFSDGDWTFLRLSSHWWVTHRWPVAIPSHDNAVVVWHTGTNPTFLVCEICEVVKFNKNNVYLFWHAKL